jgi:hypothetical protein
VCIEAKTAARRGSRRCSSIRTRAVLGFSSRSRIPNVVIAGTWEIELQTHVLYSGGMGSGIHLSEGQRQDIHEADDGSAEVAVRQDGRGDCAVERQSDVRADPDGRLTASRDSSPKRRARCGEPTTAGKTWANVSWDRRLIGRAGYYIRIRVSPDNPDDVMIANSTLWRSRDGGKIWGSGGGGCGDCHDIWWDTTPGAAGHYIVTGDSGMGIFGSPANPQGNTSVTLPIGQMYRATIDQRSPYWIYSDRQDDGSQRYSSDRPIVPSNVPTYAPPAPPPAATVGEPGGRGGGAGRGGGGGAGGRGGGGGGDVAAEPRDPRRNQCRRASPGTHIRSRTITGLCGARATPRMWRPMTSSAGKRAR